MLSLVNRYSYLIASAFAMGVTWAIGARLGGLWAIVGVAGVGTSLALIQRKLRGGSSSVQRWEEAQAEIGRGSPVLLFLYADTLGSAWRLGRSWIGSNASLTGTLTSCD